MNEPLKVNEFWRKTDNTELFTESHRNSDTDQTDQAQHHTIGKGKHQAAKGSDLAGLFTLLGLTTTDEGIWHPYNPSSILVDATCTFDANHNRYFKLGKLVVARFQVTLTAVTGSLGLDLDTANDLPPVGNYGGEEFVMGIFSLHDVGSTRELAMLQNLGGISLLRFMRTHTTNSAWNNTTPAGIGNGDELGGIFIYEAA